MTDAAEKIIAFADRMILMHKRQDSSELTLDDAYQLANALKVAVKELKGISRKMPEYYVNLSNCDKIAEDALAEIVKVIEGAK